MDILNRSRCTAIQTLIPLSCSKILLFLISLLKEKFVKFVQGGGLQLLFSYPRVSPSKGGLQYRDTRMLIEEKKGEKWEPPVADTNFYL